MAFRVNYEAYCKSKSTFGQSSFINSIHKEKSFSREIASLVLRKLEQLNISKEKQDELALQVVKKTEAPPIQSTTMVTKRTWSTRSTDSPINGGKKARRKPPAKKSQPKDQKPFVFKKPLPKVPSYRKAILANASRGIAGTWSI